MDIINIDNKYNSLNTYIDIVLGDNPKTNGLIIDGEPGFGKTTQVLKKVKESKIPYKYIKSYSTPLSLFTILQENSDKVIILDDCDNLFNNRTAVAILKGALDDSSAGRVVQWNSTTSRLLELGIESEFVFKGKIIIIVNEFNTRNNDIKAIQSRCYNVTVFFNLKEKLAILKKFVRKREERKVFKLLSEFVTEAHTFDLRVFYKLVSIYTKKGLNALKMALKDIVVEDEGMVAYFKATRDKSLRVRQQVRLFSEDSGLSRATFYRIKKKVSKSHK
jgi:hypothetical protein